jgi:hypothetical protein
MHGPLNVKQTYVFVYGDSLQFTANLPASFTFYMLTSNKHSDDVTFCGYE